MSSIVKKNLIVFDDFGNIIRNVSCAEHDIVKNVGSYNYIEGVADAEIYKIVDGKIVNKSEQDKERARLVIKERRVDAARQDVEDIVEYQQVFVKYPEMLNLLNKIGLVSDEIMSVLTEE